MAPERQILFELAYANIKACVWDVVHCELRKQMWKQQLLHCPVVNVPGVVTSICDVYVAMYCRSNISFLQSLAVLNRANL